MDILNLDLETFSTEDIKNGSFKYSEGMIILLLGYSFNFEPVKVIDITIWEVQGRTPAEIWLLLPARLRNAFLDPKVLKQSANVNFERVQLGKYFNIYIPPEQCRCTLVHAGMAGYPMKLETCAKALELDQLKQSIGKALIRIFCIPDKEGNRIMPSEFPEKWQQFIGYCAQDIYTEQAIAKTIDWYKITPLEHEIWCMVERKNERGVKIDMELVESCIYLNTIYRQQLLKEAVELTGLSNPNSRNQLKKWLEEELDQENIKSLDKNSVSKMLREVDNEKAIKVLNIRKQISKSSITKYAAMKRNAGKDHRIRGMFQYWGAQKSSRESGRLSQPQNYPRVEDWFVGMLEDTREIVRRRDIEGLDLVFDNVPAILSQLLRTAFIADTGKELAVLDYKSVEVVILAYLADETWQIEFFKKGGDLYIETAMKMYKITRDQVTKDIRQKSKISSLLCIEENQLVLTDHGTIPIKDVTLLHKVWDGEHFVTHEGVIFKGIKEVITYEGLTATPDHVVYSETHEQLQFGELATRGSHLLQSGDSGTAIRTCKNNQSRKKMEQRLETPNGFSSMHKLQNNKILRFILFGKRKIKRMPSLYTICNAEMVKTKSKRGSTTLSKSKRQKLSQLRRSGNTIQIFFGKRSRVMDFGKHGITPRSSFTIRPGKQRGELRTWQSSVCNFQSKSIKSSNHTNPFMDTRRLALFLFSGKQNDKNGYDQRGNFQGSTSNNTIEKNELAYNRKKASVYDIVNAGPHNRFTVSNVLVHNCQYGGTKRAMIKNNDTIEDPKKRVPNKEMNGIVKAWRETNKNIVAFWWEIGRAAVETVRTRVPHDVRKGISFYMIGPHLQMKMPSGKSISYANAFLKTYWMGAVKQKAEGEFNEQGEQIYEIVRVKAGEVITGEISEFNSYMRDKRWKQVENIQPKQMESLCYWGMDKVWGVIETYGPKLAQNATESWGRDLLMYSSLNFEKNGIPVNLTVHDEICGEIDEGSWDFEDLKQLMIQQPKWSEKMHLNADGFIGSFYKK